MNLAEQLITEAARDLTVNDTLFLFVLRALHSADPNTPLDPAELLEEAP